MRKILITVILGIILSCDKESTSIIESTNPPVIDSCGRNLLKGTYVSNSNILDTLVIDSTSIRTNNISACNQINRKYNYYGYCVLNNKITLKYRGHCRINLPEEIIGFSIKSNNLYFDSVSYTSNIDFYAHLTIYNYKKIK
jgi:hypothetical protein